METCKIGIVRECEIDFLIELYVVRCAIKTSAVSDLAFWGTHRHIVLSVERLQFILKRKNYVFYVTLC